MKNRSTLILFLCLHAACCIAQDWKPFSTFDFGITAGSTGVGVDVAMPVFRNVQVRTGVTFVPKFYKTMNFGVEVGMTDDAQTKQYYMDNIRQFMHEFISYDMKDNVDMRGEPTFNNAKLLIDVFPFRNKHWHITAGIYVGGRTIAKAKNRQEEISTLMGVNMYNELYKKAAAKEPMFTAGGTEVEIPNHFRSAMLEYYGEMAIHLGDFDHDVVATEDIYWDYDYYDPNTNQLVHAKGDLRCAKGDVLYHEGDAYRMKPTAQNEVTAKAKVDVIRPYVGFGYNGALGKNGNTYIGFDMGIMMWGGNPSVITHDGIDLVKDLRNVRGKVGDYVKLIKKVDAYPVIELRISQRF